MPLTTEVQVVGVEDATQKLIEYFNAYKQGTQDIKELNRQMRQVAQPIYGMNRALSLARTQWKLTHQTMMEASKIMRDVARIGRTITNMFTAYTVGQIRLELATKNYREACKEVAKAQQEYNEYLEAFGEASIYTEEAYERLQKAIEKQTEAEKELQRAQQETIIGYVGIGLQAAELTATIPTMIKHVNDFRIALSTANITAKSLVTTLGTIGAAVSGIFLGVEASMALCEAFGQLGAVASMIIGILTAIAAITAAIALNVTIASFGFAALAGIAAFGAAMAAYGAYQYFFTEQQNFFREQQQTRGHDHFWRKQEQTKGWQYGGYIPETGLYLLHAGEYVVPKHETHKTTKMINATINQYVTVTKEVDWTIASRRAIDQLIEELGEKSW